MAMTFSPKLSHSEATAVRSALVEQTTRLKTLVTLRLATDEEKIAAAQQVLTNEGILRREYGDYSPKETEAPKE